MKNVNKRGKVLVVDDEASVCKSVKRILTREHLEVDAAFSGKEALAMLEKGGYGVVITDMMMPGIGGLDVIRLVKEQWPEISIIMITGYATIKTAVQAIKLGAFDYIPKPFTPEELSGVAVRAMQRMKLHLEEGEKKVAKKAKLPKAEKRYYIHEHSWALVENDGMVRIGMDDVFQKTAGTIINIDLPFEGDMLAQGRICVRITSSGLKIHKLWSPVSGKVVAVNEEVNRNPALANEDPYGKGWLVRVEPSNLDEEIRDLVFIG